jgi:hypothetical protein
MSEVNKWYLSYFKFSWIYNGEESGRKGTHIMRNKIVSLKNSCLYWCFNFCLSFFPCLSWLPQLILLQQRGYSEKSCLFFPFSFEAAWRLRIACLKVTWFRLKCKALETVQFMEDAAVLVRLCSLWRGKMERNAQKAGGLVLGCKQFFLIKELLGKPQVIVENASCNLFISCLQHTSILCLALC